MCSSLSLSLLLSFSLVALRVLLFLNLYRSRAATAAARVFAHIRFRVAIAGRIIIRTQVRFFLASVWYTFTSRSPLSLPLPFAFVEETSPSATTFSAWQTRSARACCDFYSLAFYFCFSSSSPTVLSRSSPPPLSPFFLHFLSIRSHSSLSLSASVFVCPPLCVGLVIQTDTLLLSPFASSSR